MDKNIYGLIHKDDDDRTFIEVINKESGAIEEILLDSMEERSRLNWILKMIFNIRQRKENYIVSRKEEVDRLNAEIKSFDNTMEDSEFHWKNEAEAVLMQIAETLPTDTKDRPIFEGAYGKIGWRQKTTKLIDEFDAISEEQQIEMMTKYPDIFSTIIKSDKTKLRAAIKKGEKIDGFRLDNEGMGFADNIEFRINKTK